MTPPPWPSLEWRKQSGSSSILASQSKTTISNSVHAGLEALKYPSHAVSIKPSNKMYTISFSSFVLIEIFYARPLTETKWKGLYPRKADTSNSVRENVGYDGWVGVRSGEVRVELWGMPVSYLQNPKIINQDFKNIKRVTLIQWYSKTRLTRMLRDHIYTVLRKLPSSYPRHDNPFYVLHDVRPLLSFIRGLVRD